MDESPAQRNERSELLADVAELYYNEGLTQSEIADQFGVTRSAISRMLTEARDRGIVEIRVIRQLRFDNELSEALSLRFEIPAVSVLVWKQHEKSESLRERLGQAAAGRLVDLLTPGITIGVPWGTTVSATIEALEINASLGARVVQMVGVLGSSSHAYNGQVLVERLAKKVGGTGVYLYTPGIVENAETARVLLNNPDIRQTIEIGRSCEIALLGIGTTDPAYSSLHLGGHISPEELEYMTARGAVGDISGYFFDGNGQLLDIEFHKRLVGLPFEDLLCIPVRLAVAGGPSKAAAILGALRGRLVNMLMTDSLTAQQLLAIASL